MSGHVCESWARSVSKSVFCPWALQRISLEVRADHVLAHISVEQHFTCSRHRPQDRALVMFHSVRQHRRFLISLMLLASNSILASVCAYSIGFSRASALPSGLKPCTGLGYGSNRAPCRWAEVLSCFRFVDSMRHLDYLRGTIGCLCGSRCRPQRAIYFSCQRLS